MKTKKVARVRKRTRPKPKAPSVQGINRKSVMLRVDAEFAERCREAAPKSVTAFTRKLVNVWPMVQIILANQPVPTVEKA